MNTIIDLKRLDNETDEELIYRICSTKDEIGSWQDVADILNNLLNTEYTESKFRKQFQSFQKMLDANQSRILEDDNYLKELELKMEQIRKERIKLQTANIERSRVDRNVSRQEMYYEFVGNLCNTLPLPEFYPVSIPRDEDKRYLVTIADVHYGAKFISENNEYSPEIARERFESLTGELINFVRHNAVSTIYIASLGDLIQGLLRVSDLKLNDTSVVKATVEISRIIALMLNELSAYVNIEYYHVPNANHSQTRPLGTKASEIADEDMEYLIGNYIKDLCSSNDRIHINLAEEGKQYIQIPIYSYEIIAMHGHQLKNIESSIKDLSMLRRTFLDYVILGHYHGGREIPSYEGCCNDTEILVSPSFIGSDPYSDSIMKGSKAAVKIYGFDDLYGHTETYKIILN
ncbi:hypothetical protein K413DRAFT_4727 [Clostridium sp. ASBs410]|nr:hypothetical protein K413DRAFT_4727 [Clostridium sp. ASBs410]